MTMTPAPHSVPDPDNAALKPLGFKLSKSEGLFFQCLIDATRLRGVRPPKGRDIPKEVKRVVDYDHVKLLMVTCH